MKKFSLVLPIKIKNSNFLMQVSNGPKECDDLERLIKIQLPTFRKFLDVDSVDKFYIICLPNELDVIKTKLTKEFPEFPFEFLSEDEVLPEVCLDNWWEGKINPGHIKQQILKFNMSSIVKTEQYILLDCDVFLTRKFTYDDLFHNDKVIFTSLRKGPEKPHGEHFWLNSSAFLFGEDVENIITGNEEQKSGIKDKTLYFKKCISVTPEIFITEKVKELLKFIEKKYEMNYVKVLLDFTQGGSSCWSEYALYWSFLAYTGELEDLYAFDGPGLFGNELWRYAEQAAMERTLEDYYERLNLVFEHKEIADWCWNPHSEYYFSLVQSNIQQLDLERLEKRIKEICQLG
tara:strand:+ start:106 stop:1143 length:1038 start_codon:yes stop_codon:yes gene_type:complete